MTVSRTVEADKLANQRGFTLIELSIVLAIIGLLVGGVLKGQEMVNGARLKTTVAQVQAYRAAIGTFQDKYGALPGDYTLASTNILAGVANGNGNGVIGNNGNVPTWRNATLTTEEDILWQQLAAAKMITGVQAIPTAVGVGTSFPAGNVTGSAWGFQYSTASFPNTGTYFFVLSSSVGGGIILPGRDAWALDSKYDDGFSNTGSIVTNQAACATAATGVYVSTATAIGCNLAFSLY